MLFIFIFSCSSLQEKISYDRTINVRHADISIPDIYLDSFFLESFHNSFSGNVFTNDNRLLFVDSRFCWVNVFDKNGKFLFRKVGQGDGLNEIAAKKISFYTNTPEGKHLFLGPSWDVYVFDNKFRKEKEYRINWGSKSNLKELKKNPDSNDPNLYSVTYGLGKLQADNKYVYLPLFSQFTSFNITKDTYSKNARILGIMNIENGKVIGITGKLPPIFYQNKNVRTFSYGLFEILPDNKLAVVFPVDSNIYVVDRNDFQIIKKFGFMGKGMDTNYLSTNKYDEMKNIWNREVQEKGNYNSIFYEEDKDIYLRSYHKGGKSEFDGLQIYHGDTLVGDVNVPKGMTVSGYIKPYFYSDTFISEKESNIKIYRFKINL